MHSLFVHLPADPESLTVRLWELGTTGIVEQSTGWRAYFEDSGACLRARSALASFVQHSFQETAEVCEQPVQACAQGGEEPDPILVGDRFVILPPRSQAPVPAGRLRLEIDSPTAFGTGRHESTQLALRALERHMNPGCRVIDVGCGSGILSAAASLLGAATVAGCDVHPQAVRAAASHLPASLFYGTVDAVRSSAFDLTVANISAPVVDRIAADLDRITHPEGLLILAGFLAENPPSSFRPHHVYQENGWQCWVCRPRQTALPPGNYQSAIASFAENWWL